MKNLTNQSDQVTSILWNSYSKAKLDFFALSRSDTMSVRIESIKEYKPMIIQLLYMENRSLQPIMDPSIISRTE